MAKHSVVDSGDLRKYFTAIPNVVFDLGLNPYELALYAHFKQVAGDDGGACWKSRATIAKESGMSSGMVTKARQALETQRAELAGQPLITVTEEPSKTGGKPTCRIAITDIWGANMAKFAPSPHDVDARAPSPHDERRHHTTIATSPHDPKEKLLEEELNKNNKRDFISDLKTDPLYSHVDLDYQIALMQRWLARPQNKGRRMTERFVLNWLGKIERPLVVSSNGNGHVGRYKPNDAAEVCLRCNNTGHEMTSRGARPCDHKIQERV